MVKYQFEIDDETWNAWKETVPRRKTLSERLIELIEEDTERQGLDSPDSPDRVTISKGVDSWKGVEEVLESIDLPGSGETEDRRREAIRSLYDYLRENRTATKSEFLDLVDADEVGYASPDSFWSNCVKATGVLAALPGVDAPGEGEHTWRYSGVRENG